MYEFLTKRGLAALLCLTVFALAVGCLIRFLIHYDHGDFSTLSAIGATGGFLATISLLINVVRSKEPFYVR